MVKCQLPFIGICNFVAKRDNSDRENLVPIERATTWRNVQRRRTQSRQVTILPTVDELQEAEGHPLENIQEPEQINRPNCKKVHLAFLPDKYEPLVECAAECANEESRADKKYKRKQKLKKCRKNIVKVLRAGWHYFILGIQEFANNYTTPYSTSFAVIAEMR